MSTHRKSRRFRSNAEPVDHVAMLVEVVTTADELDDRLDALNQAGITPVIVGFSRFGDPFLAYGWAPGGDGWDCGFVDDDPHSSEFDLDGVERCQECGAFERRPLDQLNFPVTIITREAGQ